MQVSVETTSELGRKLTVEVPGDEVASKVQSKLQALAKKVRLDGFRPGKVPVSVVKQRYGDSILHEVVGDIIQKTLPEALSQEKINPAGMPAVDPNMPKQGENLKYIATFEVYPKIELKSLKGEALEKATCEINDSDIEAMLENIRKQHAEWEETDAACEKGDKTTLDFEGKIEGESFEGNSAEGFELELGSGQMIPGFEDGIIGMKAGEKKTIDVNFPEDYHGKDVAGKAAQFDINLHKIQRANLPELNDEFVKRFDIKSGGIDKLREDIRESMQRELDNKLLEINKQAVFEKLVSLNSFETPKALVDSEIEGMQKQFMQQISGGRDDVDVSNFPAFPREMFEEKATKRVQLGLLLREYVDVNKLKVDKERAQKHLETMSRAYDKPEDVLALYNKSEEHMAQVEAKVLEDQVVDALIAEADVSDKPMAYADVMQHQAQN